MRRTHLFSLVFLFLSTFLLVGCGKETAVGYKVDLEVWGVFDDSDAYGQLFSEYRKINPFIGNITYRKFSPETYREELLNALASGKGPDIFMIGNTWLDMFQDKTNPAPNGLFTEKEFRDAFVDVVAEDFLSTDKQVYAVPLFMDSLALYYNKDIFNAAGITEPPKTWEEVLALTPRLTKGPDAYGNITQSAIALGTAYNVNRSSDLLLNFNNQLGTTVTGTDFSGENARKSLEYYTQFAKSGSPYYTWNSRLHYSLDAFYEGTVAMMLNYSYQYDTIKQKNAKFNFGVAPLPQFAGMQAKNFANYWGFAVAKNKALPVAPSGQEPGVPPDQYQTIRTAEAWELLRYLSLPHPTKTFTTTNFLSGTTKDFPMIEDPTLAYLNRTNKPAARRDLIEAQKSDVKLAPFALGNLIARSWKPVNPEEAEKVLAEGIDAINKGGRSASDALAVITQRLSQLRGVR